MSRIQASLYHLLASVLVLLTLAYVIVFVWYPDFFFAIDGGWEGLRILIFVDIVLGPLLTLCVYKAGKPGLKFDLTCIALLQTSCLAAGMYVVYEERPIFFVFQDGHFYSANNDTYEQFGRATPDLERFSQSTPIMVIATVPDDPIEEADFRKEIYSKGFPLWSFDPSYVEIDGHLDQVLLQAFDYDNLRARDRTGELSKWLKKYGGELEDYAFFPVHSRYQRPFIAIRKADKTFVDVINIAAPLAG